MRRFLPGFLMVLAALRIDAAAPAPPPVIGSTEAELVRVSVAVTDKDGRPVTDLKAIDFVLTDAGQPQEISVFVPGSAPTMMTAEPAAAADHEARPASDAPRHIVLAIDDLHLSGPSIIRAKAGLKSFVSSSLRPTDEIALATTSGAGVSRAFTTDRAAILAAIDSLAPNERRPSAAGRTTMNQAQAEAIERNDARAIELAIQEISADIGIGRQAPWAGSEAKSQARQIIAQATQASNAALSFAEDMVRGLQPFPGRKLVVLVSDGFMFSPPTEPAAFDLRSLIDASARADVAIYPLSARGVATEVDASVRGRGFGVMPGEHALWGRTQETLVNDALGAVADGTGGQYVRGSNDVASGLRNIVADNASAYLIAFSPGHEDRRRRFHKIEVKVPSRPDLQIRARRGYLSRDPKERETPPVEAAEKRRKQDIRNGLSALVPRREVPVTLRTDFVDRAPEGPQLVLSAHVDARDVRFQRTDGRYKAELEFVRVVADESGRIVAPGDGHTAALDLTQSAYEKTIQEGIGFQSVVPLTKPGRYEVRMIVREGRTLQVGSARQWVEVPDTRESGLLMSGVFLFAPSEEKKDAAPALKDVQATRSYPRDAALFYAAHVYNPSRDDTGAADVVSQAQVRKDGQLQGASPVETVAFEARETARPVRGRIDLAGMPPGGYELRVLLVDRKAGTHAERRIDFSIE